MRSQITRIITQQQKSLKSLSARSITTSTDPRKAAGLSLKVKEELFEYGEIQNSLYPPAEFRRSDTFSFIFQNIKHWGHKTYTECALTGRKNTFSETYDGALRWGAAIKKLLPNSTNPTVAFICPNSPDYVTMFIGTMAAGAVVSPMNPMYTPGETATQLEDSRTELLVVDEMLEPLADAALQILGKSIPVVVIGQSKHGRPNAHELLRDSNAKMLDYQPIDPNTVALLPYSSGTTGKPKGVEITQQSVVNNLLQAANHNVLCNREAYGDHQEVLMGILPFFHVFGITATMLPGAYFGSRVITMPKFDPMLYVETIKKIKISSYQIVPLLLQFMATFPGITKEDLEPANNVICGSSPLSPEIALAMKEKAPQASLQEGYGMTETLISLVTPYSNEKIGFCGQLLAGIQAKVIDMKTGDLLPANTSGELLIKTPSAMKGYRNNETATKETLDEEGWIHTGDVAAYTEDGFFTIIDRIKELIKVKGLQVSPTELEETIQKHPGVYEVGVVGVPHEQFGEAPVAFIVPADSDVTEGDIHSFMEGRVAKHKQLAGGIRFVDELPKNPTGKLLRKVLKTMATEK